jgi:hypothetical protein
MQFSEVAGVRLPATVAARERRLRRADLPTWSRIGGAKSANEVAQINKQKEQFAERRSPEVIRD